MKKGWLYTLVLRELRLQRKLEDLQNRAEAPNDRTCREDRVERWRDQRLCDSSSPNNPELEFQLGIPRFWIQLPLYNIKVIFREIERLIKLYLAI